VCGPSVRPFVETYTDRRKRERESKRDRGEAGHMLLVPEAVLVVIVVGGLPLL
jgi:hypothetical protein